MGTAESEELDGLWTSHFTFIALFLLSVTYGASVTLFKVGQRPCSTATGGPGRPTTRGSPGQSRAPHAPSSQVKWVFVALLQEPQLTHDYANVRPPAWAWRASSAGLSSALPTSEHR